MAHGNKNEHIEEVMNQKGVKLHSLIIKPLSDEKVAISKVIYSS
jgi:hypothetical protein